MTIAAVMITGSKGGAGVAQCIVSLMPPHELYIEAFAGLAAVGRLKRPARCDVFVERDIDRSGSCWVEALPTRDASGAGGQQLEGAGAACAGYARCMLIMCCRRTRWVDPRVAAEAAAMPSSDHRRLPQNGLRVRSEEPVIAAHLSLSNVHARKIAERAASGSCSCSDCMTNSSAPA